MKNIIIGLVLLLSSSLVLADASIFYADGDSVGIGLGVTHITNSEMIATGGISLAANSSDIYAGIGYKISGISIILGAGNSTGESERHEFEHELIPSKLSKSSYGKGRNRFIDIEYNNFFIRYQDKRLDYKYNSSVVKKVDGIIVAVESKSFSETLKSNPLWIGYRFKF